ncbi:hypothetical protein DIJ64_08800 [Mycobacterium leprae]|uniref:Uncharacterized protein n=1 Tax=Mycobacterium leprae TaxID=1769 RepID=A0AAD0KUB2_MYCLR|nr:hypothetical protein [Mycobacterium leprae]AWV48123.1 hypothetical protein DIJ64_08800 [Mycobacterium leprae]OAR21625.1 hypothetical protein A8144_05060 [Mycobacterium leprae 3125609]
MTARSAAKWTALRMLPVEQRLVNRMSLLGPVGYTEPLRVVVVDEEERSNLDGAQLCRLVSVDAANHDTTAVIVELS